MRMLTLLCATTAVALQPPTKKTPPTPPQRTNLDAAALAFGAIILPPSTHLHAEPPEVSITELVWSLGDAPAEGALRKSPSFSDSFAWVSG